MAADVEHSIHFKAPTNGQVFEDASELSVTLDRVTGPTFVLMVGPLRSQTPSFDLPSATAA